ncbi:SRPBCC family protein [Levilactobacillus fujinensis]|uniref:SRPBCC family protein n=1 Tax=Levilactobacillus fujinensis TaxID=2486024 RepID=A0ABW1TII0_9LACO|nr:SRPBCC family protein [Levilactobacillus fujinensis]
MSENLFQNVILTHAHQERLRAILIHPENLPLWDDEITQIIPTANGAVQLSRRPPALNEHEWLTVTTTASQISYHSHGGRLDYELVFTLVGDTTQTSLTEELRVTNTTSLPVPLRLLVPIAKAAFSRKLQALVALAESSGKVFA